MGAFLVHQQSGNNLSLEDTVIIAQEWVGTLGPAKGVMPFHARIRRTDDGYQLETNEGSTMVNGLPSEARMLLNHNDVLLFGDKKKGAYFIFKNEQQKQKQMDTRKLKLMNFQQNKHVAENMTKDFFQSCPVGSLQDFAKFLLDFLVKNFRIHRGVLYRVAGKKWLPVIAKATATTFVPPRTILDRVWQSRKPERFSMTEVDDTAELSRSIVSNRVYSAICFPIEFEGEMIAVIYMDTQDEQVQLSADDLMVLCTLVPAIGGLLRVLLAYDNVAKESVELVSSLCMQEKTETFQYQLLNTSFERGLTYFKHSEKSDFVFLLRIQSGKKLTVPAWATYYTKFLTTVQCTTFEQGYEDETILRILKPLVDTFPDLRVDIGVLSYNFQTKMLRFSGKGRVFLYVKEHKTYLMDLSTLAQPYTTLLEKEYVRGAFFMTTFDKTETVCAALDKIADALPEGLKQEAGNGFFGVLGATK